MATASEMIDSPIFGTASDDDGSMTYLTVNMDGETYIMWPDKVVFTNDANYEKYEFNMTGPEGGITLPFLPTMFPDHIGWAINTGGGQDTIIGYTLTDVLQGGTGNDSIKGEGGRDILYGDAGKDTLFGGEDDDWVYGGSENDNVYGGNGDDWMHGGAGNDWMNADQGMDTMSGGLGNDMYRMSKNDSDFDQIVEKAGEGFDWVYTDWTSFTLKDNLEGLILDAAMTASTILNGNGLNNDIRGAAGSDLIYSYGGNDTITGNGGGDALRGGYGNDTVFGGAGNDKTYGEDGNDYIDGGTGTDTMDGGLGNDTYVLEDATDVITEALNGGVDEVQSLLATTTLGANVENLKMLFAGASTGFGNALNNIVNGSVWANYIDVGAGNDTVFAGLGNDTVYGNLGDDALQGDYGDDRVYGGEGNDLLGGFEGSDWVYGDAGNDQLNGGDGTDFLFGGTGDDRVFGAVDGTGKIETDYVYGDAGNDTVDGGEGNDLVRGGEGNDLVYGADGNDTLYGDAGVDLVYGGNGADRFVFRSLADGPLSGLDRIMDFVQGTDKIDLSQIDANSATATNDAFFFNAVKPFFASPGDLNMSQNLLGTLVQGDVNGDGVSDFRFLVVGNYSMLASDFIL